MWRRLVSILSGLLLIGVLQAVYAAVEITIHCPKQIPIKLDRKVLGSQWQQGKTSSLRLYSSSLHRSGGLLRCHYRLPGGEVVTTIVRDFPKGFDCKTGGKGVFVCRH